MDETVPKLLDETVAIHEENEQGIIIDAEVAAQIDFDAFSCYAGFPSKKISKVDILRFMLAHCHKIDLYAIIIISFLAGLVYCLDLKRQILKLIMNFVKNGTLVEKNFVNFFYRRF